MAKIDVIIPAFNAHDYIVDALNSVAIQNIVSDLKVYLVNDCSTHDYKEEVDKFKDKLDIVELKTDKNVGPGLARQYGIDHSNGEYIVFLDSDDVFSDEKSIEEMINNIEDNDVLISDFREEVDDINYMHYENFIWMHGKMYKREFLNRMNIRFNDSYSNEDTGFNTLVSMCTNKVKYINVVTYIWKYNENSITRRNNGEFEFSGLKGFIDNICWAICEAEKKNIEENTIAKVSYEAILEIYYNYVKYYNDNNKDLLLDWSKSLKRLYLKHINNIYEATKRNSEFTIIDKGLRIAGSEAILKNNLSFYDFLEKIKE